VKGLTFLDVFPQGKLFLDRRWVCQACVLYQYGPKDIDNTSYKISSGVAILIDYMDEGRREGSLS
jgi:hypothetical protein